MNENQDIFSHRETGPNLSVQRSSGAEVFPYWSFTKTVIAICALKIVELGKLDLDEHLADHDFSLRQLLNHTAGLPDYYSLPGYRKAVANDEEPWSADHLFNATMAQGSLFVPGEGWAYSNLGYMLARDLIEDVAGSSFSSLVSEMICDPLGLDSIELATTRKHLSRVHWDGAKRYHPGWVYHGCLTGTAADAARLLHALFTGRLLNADILEQMLIGHPLGGAVEGRPWTKCGYATGLMSGRCGSVGRTVGHSGGGPYSVNAVYHFPDLKGPVTVASFTDGRNEGVAEFAAVECAGQN
ncbi:serine hydrolase domain-containing protein [Phaeobacter porticola]|uniref:D-alanyl-D-alanine carboxypeptidase n=1 Tax=Phaeobacter porticola TaxID=1844006 RepID=A0A1L3IAE7_9RHOB|nr:serine hydrolase domain-containing protein [Phaeobacter porticola]APG49140.1 D-alanyl-D-alanine carboxypeptidase precursor [Phaeobacter porticola]